MALRIDVDECEGEDGGGGVTSRELIPSTSPHEGSRGAGRGDRQSRESFTWRQNARVRSHGIAMSISAINARNARQARSWALTAP